MGTFGDRHDSDILFSRMVKAGRRIYYVDVKQDRRGGYYVSVTESKRVRDAQEGQSPLFEKHKIFLYREDVYKFMEAFSAAADFAVKQPGFGHGETFRTGLYTEDDGATLLRGGKDEADDADLGMDIDFSWDS